MQQPGPGIAAYRALGVEPDATPSQIKRAYHKLALRYHPDKNPAAGERFNEISSAYSLLSDPQKRQLYDQFGDTGVQMIDAMAQTGLPRWLFLPAAQRIACGLVSTALVVFVVLLPLSILMRAENEDGWPWVVVLIPLWLLDALYGLALAIRLVAALRGTSRDEAADTHPALGVRPTLIAIGVYLCVVGAQVLLTMRLSSTAETCLLSYTLSLVPLYVALLPTAIPSLIIVATSLWRRMRPTPQHPAPTCVQLVPHLVGLGGTLLVASTVALAALNGDAVLDLNWWIVLAPTWLHCALLWLRWLLAVRSLSQQTQQTPPPSEEERTAKMGGLFVAGGLGALLTISLLLLSLRVGGQAHYPAPVIFAPVFGVLAFGCCCCCCIACVANAVSRAQRNAEGGHPPYTDLRDEEAPPPNTPGADGAAGSGGGGAGGDCGSARPTMPASPPTRATPEEASRMAEAVDLGQSIATGPKPLDAMSTRELKEELTSRGVDHEHCLEKGELMSLLAATRSASGK